MSHLPNPYYIPSSHWNVKSKMLVTMSSTLANTVLLASLRSAQMPNWARHYGDADHDARLNWNRLEQDNADMAEGPNLGVTGTHADFMCPPNGGRGTGQIPLVGA
jgi:hypothetical protein